ncbi:MAG: hypothetical protein KC416_10550 [Myxococcales bacterium]|nr:hypothetical protein [Myxococcales bacterium]
MLLRIAVRRRRMTGQGRKLRSTAAIVLVALLGALGCAAFADKHEYSAYRKIRIAPDERERLLAMQEYASSYPQGQWAEEVAQERNALEPQLWEEGKDSIEGLIDYLEAFPNGPHADEARPRLEALRAVGSRRRGEEAQAQETRAKRAEQAKEKRRTWMTQAVDYWVPAFLQLKAWGQPIAEVVQANPSFERAFGRQPRPRCSTEECVKFYFSNYAIPVPGGTRLDRQMQLYLRLLLREGNVERSEFLLPNRGFSRWYEQEHRVPVIDEDPEQRQQAIAWALDRIIPVLEGALPDAHRVDIIPDAIKPPQIRAPNEPEPIEAPDGGEAPVDGQGTDDNQERPDSEEPTKPSDSDEPSPGDSELGELIERAAAKTEEGDPLPEKAAPQEAPAETPAPATETIFFPIALVAYETGSLRVVVFAASDDATGKAYDGLYIERIPPTGP